MALCRMKESISRDRCEFAVKILMCGEQCHVTVGVISELSLKEPPGTLPGTIGYSAADGLYVLSSACTTTKCVFCFKSRSNLPFLVIFVWDNNNNKCICIVP